MRVVLEDVVAGYGFGDVLRGSTWCIEAGEITCLIGRTAQASRPCSAP